MARLVFIFCCALTTGRCYAFQHITGTENKSEFYGPNLQIILQLYTVKFTVMYLQLG